jgi:hypothetical protein
MLGLSHHVPGNIEDNGDGIVRQGNLTFKSHTNSETIRFPCLIMCNLYRSRHWNLLPVTVDIGIYYRLQVGAATSVHPSRG